MNLYHCSLFIPFVCLYLVLSSLENCCVFFLTCC